MICLACGATRMKNLRAGVSRAREELEALAQFVSVMGFMFGFMRPAVLRQDRDEARRMATTIARILGRSFQSLDLFRNAQGYPPEVGSSFFS